MPGGVMTGRMFYKAVEYLLCFLGDIDESMSFFLDVCTVVSVVGQVSPYEAANRIISNANVL